MDVKALPPPEAAYIAGRIDGEGTITRKPRLRCYISGRRKTEVCELKRQQAIDLLTRSKPELQERFGVIRLALFGSTARDTATSSSDIDILVAFDGPATSARYFGVQFYLEDLFGCPVDLVTEKACGPSCAPTSNRSGSMSDAGKRVWRFYIDDMLEFAGKVVTYTTGLDQASFVADGLTYDATLRNLELLG